MAQNKNQHYVPKCHLRPFADGEKKTVINLYNVRRDRSITGASIKGQCSRNYFYGQDPALEEILQDMEGSYATAIKELEKLPVEVPEDTLGFLREFAYLQYSRTAKAAERRRAQIGTMHEISARPTKINSRLRMDPVDLSHQAMVLGNLRTWIASCSATNWIRIARQSG